MIDILKNRFLENPVRHRDLTWEDVEIRLRGNLKALDVLRRMEEDAEAYAMTMRRS